MFKKLKEKLTGETSGQNQTYKYIYNYNYTFTSNCSCGCEPNIEQAIDEIDDRGYEWLGYHIEEHILDC